MQNIITQDDPLLFDACAEIFVRRCIENNTLGLLVNGVTTGIERFEIRKTAQGDTRLEVCFKSENLVGAKNENSESI